MGQLAGMKIICRPQRRRSWGTISLEMAIASIFLVIFGLLGADIGYSLYGADFNDRACRDAARAAAQCNNSNSATNKVNAILQAHQCNGAFISGPVLDNFVYEDYSVDVQPANSSPFVTVTTHTRINMPFCIGFQGVSYVSKGSGYTFTQSYTFPLLSVH
jgi:Flp pilus assembly protein TadG